MPRSLKSAQARRMARRLNPHAAKRVVWREKYHTPVYFGEHLERVDEEIFNNPRHGLRLAEVAPRLAELIQPDLDAHGRELRIRAWAALGSACRSLSRYEEAESAYSKAFGFVGLDLSATVRADLLKRYALLKTSQGCAPEALALIDEALALYGEPPTDFFGELVATRGLILGTAGRIHESIGDLSRALMIIRPGPAPRVYVAALANLATALEIASPATAHGIFKLPEKLKQARVSLPDRRSLLKAKLKWLEGRAWRRLEMWPAAERRFEAARRRLLDLGAVYDAALCALDQLELYRSDGREFKIESTAAETLAMVSGGDRSVVDAVQAVADAAREQSLRREIIAKAREAIERRLERKSRARPGAVIPL